MNKKIVLRKVLEGAATGFLSAAAVLRPDDFQKGGQALMMALLVGVLAGGLNAWKHRNEGRLP